MRWKKSVFVEIHKIVVSCEVPGKNIWLSLVVSSLLLCLCGSPYSARMINSHAFPVISFLFSSSLSFCFVT